MSKIDFVPDEYIQQRESNRANLMYLALLLAVLMGMGLTFSILKIRQSKVNEEVAILDERLYKAHEQIILLEKLETKGKGMMKTALITAELPDLVGDRLEELGDTFADLNEGVLDPDGDLGQIFVRAVHRVAKLQGRNRLPALFFEDLPALSGALIDAFEFFGEIAL